MVKMSYLKTVHISEHYHKKLELRKVLYNSTISEELDNILEKEFRLKGVISK